MPNESVTFELNTKVTRNLEREAKSRNQARSEIVSEALTRYFEQQDAEKRVIAELKQEAKCGRWISEEAMDAWVQSWDSEDELPMPRADIIRS